MIAFIEQYAGVDPGEAQAIFARGTWRLARERRGATLHVGALSPLAPDERDAVAAEAESLAEFLGAEEIHGI